MLSRCTEFASLTPRGCGYADRPMPFRKLWPALALVTFAGCDLFNKTSSQVSALNVMVATVLSTPEIVVSPQAIAGLDAGFLNGFDGGFDFDGGVLPDGGTFSFDAGGFGFSLDSGIDIPAQTAVLVFFGVRSSTDLTTAPTGVDDAVITAATPTKTWTLKGQTGGTYTLTSQDDPTLVYQPGVTWTFTSVSMAQTYTGEVDDAPGPEGIFQLHPAAGYIELDAGTGYELTRPDPPVGQERVLGFVTVFPISLEGTQGDPTYTDVPSTPLDFLKLAAAPDSWEQTLVEIPGTAFPNPAENYVILFQTAKLGGASTDNLFIGSPMIAGTADVGIVKTR